MRCCVCLYIANLVFLCSRIRSHTHLGNHSRQEGSSNSSLDPNYHHSVVSAPPLCSVFESPGHLSIMPQTLRKRGREPESLADSNDVQKPKRFPGEQTDRFLDLLQLDQSLAEEEEEYAPSEELVSGVMRSLEEEIASTWRKRYFSGL